MRMLRKRTISSARRRDKLLGLLIITVGFAGCMTLSIWGMAQSTPKSAPPPADPILKGIPGFPQSVSPFEVLASARSLSVRPKFRGFVAKGVKRDGTIDFTQKKSSLRFSFQSPKGRGYQPPRKGGTLPDRRYCGHQSVKLDKKGLVATKDDPDRSCKTKTPLNLREPENCSLQDLWNLAVKNKFRKRGNAHIEFFESKTGPAYRFKKQGRTLVVSTKTCRKIKGREARGTVP